MDRRDFFRAAGGLGLVAFSEADRAEAAQLTSAPAPAPVDVQWGKAPCRFCGTGCGVEVGVREGKVVAVRGDEASPVNKGRGH